MPGPETPLQRRIRSALQAEFGGYWYKVHGSRYQPAGIPDLSGVTRPRPDTPGRPIYVEVKTPTGEISAIQVHRMRELMDAGAGVCVATSVDEAVLFVRALLDDPGLRFCFQCMCVRSPYRETTLTRVMLRCGTCARLV